MTLAYTFSLYNRKVVEDWTPEQIKEIEGYHKEYKEMFGDDGLLGPIVTDGKYKKDKIEDSSFDNDFYGNYADEF